MNNKHKYKIVVYYGENETNKYHLYGNSIFNAFKAFTDICHNNKGDKITVKLIKKPNDKEIVSANYLSDLENYLVICSGLLPMIYFRLHSI